MYGDIYICLLFLMAFKPGTANSAVPILFFKIAHDRQDTSVFPNIDHHSVSFNPVLYPMSVG